MQHLVAKKRIKEFEPQSRKERKERRRNKNTIISAIFFATLVPLRLLIFIDG
ncbi:MAG TPA: hypothetical protein VGG19_02935 [Tepidisphaeraceae bacterium]|jgi:hypothetical protein